MACYHPLIGIRTGLTANGKPKYTITSKLCMDANRVAMLSDRSILIPCGQCIGCRIQYSREWANRMLCEYDSIDPDKRKNTYFVTLTYDEMHLPERIVNTDDGFKLVHPLQKDHVSEFMKRLRARFPDVKNIRFYAAGEYGDRSGRPHYHLILYNLPLDRNNPYHLKFWKIKKSGDLDTYYYSSPLLESIWSDSYQTGYKQWEHIRRGMVCVTDVSWHTFAYTARYVTKKLSGRKLEEFTASGLTSPFALMSRRPGIGRNFYDENEDYIKKYAKLSLSDSENSYTFYSPKYYRRLYEFDDPSFEEVRKARQEDYHLKILKKLNDNPGKDLFDLLAEEEALFKKNAADHLVRPDF